jgi:NAD-dependent dihydropyrimidine dehydrogenase PreA subunit
MGGCQVVLCRWREQQTDGVDARARQMFDEELLHTLGRQPGCEILVTPHLYDLTVDGPTLARLRSLAGPLVVLAWLPERATCWLLRKAGVEGRLATMPARHGQDAHGATDGMPRPMWCVDLCAYEKAEACVAAIAPILASVSPGGGSTRRGAAVETLDEPTSARWYPVIDYDRCKTCLECLNFCLFGVYGLDAAEAVRVEQPDACRPGCPACARVCPSRAILFPECPDPEIAGRANAPADGLFSGANGGPLPAGVPRSSSGERGGTDRTGGRPDKERRIRTQGPTPIQGGSLDDLVDDVDDFDV